VICIKDVCDFIDAGQSKKVRVRMMGACAKCKFICLKNKHKNVVTPPEQAARLRQ
jgi:hypothetical protein